MWIIVPILLVTETSVNITDQFHQQIPFKVMACLTHLCNSSSKQTVTVAFQEVVVVKRRQINKN